MTHSSRTTPGEPACAGWHVTQPCCSLLPAHYNRCYFYSLSGCHRQYKSPWGGGSPSPCCYVGHFSLLSLCLPPPAQHTRTGGDRTWGQCPVRREAPGLGTAQSLPCLLSLGRPCFCTPPLQWRRSPERQGAGEHQDAVPAWPWALLVQTCRGASHLHRNHGAAPSALLQGGLTGCCKVLPCCPGGKAPGLRSTLTLPDVPRETAVSGGSGHW